jgi:hypothetical protein
VLDDSLEILARIGHGSLSLHITFLCTIVKIDLLHDEGNQDNAKNEYHSWVGCYGKIGNDPITIYVCNNYAWLDASCA